MAGDIGFRAEEDHIEEVSGVRKVYNEDHGEREAYHQHKETKQPGKRHPKEYMRAIAKAAESSNRQLEQKGSDYRFRVYEEKGEVMIDIVTMDRSGKIIREVKRNITNEDFDRLIEDISLIEGLFFDSMG